MWLIPISLFLVLAASRPISVAFTWYNRGHGQPLRFILHTVHGTLIRDLVADQMREVVDFPHESHLKSVNAVELEWEHVKHRFDLELETSQVSGIGRYSPTILVPLDILSQAVYQTEDDKPQAF
jgi:hypothetical protein